MEWERMLIGQRGVERVSGVSITLKVNGREVSADVPRTMTLLSFVRDVLGLTGTKEGCGKGECGACTVLLDGQAVNSCLVPAFQAHGREVTTIEGLAQDGELDAIQRHFVSEGAIQCGFCTPGMILSAKALLMRNSRPTRQEIREAISGNLCRCTGYVKIVNAIEKAAMEMHAAGPGAGSSEAAKETAGREG